MALQYTTRPHFTPSSSPTQIPSSDIMTYSVIPEVHPHCPEFSSFGCSQGSCSCFHWPLFQCKVLREDFSEYPTWNRSLQTKLPDALSYFMYLSLSEILHICVYPCLCVYIYIHCYMECKVKWALGSITTNKASGGDGIPVELFQILKDDAVKVLHSVCQQIWKPSSGHRTGKGHFSFQSLRKAMPKKAQTTTQLHSSYTLAK